MNTKKDTGDIKYLEIDKRLENEIKLLDDELDKIFYDGNSEWNNNNNNNFNIAICKINLKNSLDEEINLREVQRHLFAKLLDETLLFEIELNHEKDIIEIPLPNSRYFTLKLDESCRVLEFSIRKNDNRYNKCGYEDESYAERFADDLVWNMLKEFEFSLGNNKSLINQKNDKDQRGYHIIPKTPISDMYRMMYNNYDKNYGMKYDTDPRCKKTLYDCEKIIDKGIRALFSILFRDVMWIDKIIPLLDNMFEVMVLDTTRYCKNNR